MDMPCLKKLVAPVLALSLLLVFACAGPSVKKTEKPHGVYHRVKKGETLWGIAKAYNTDILDLLVVNKIKQADTIEADSVIFIPGADHVEESATPAEPPEQAPAAAVKEKTKPAGPVREKPQPVKEAVKSPAAPPAAKAATKARPRNRTQEQASAASELGQLDAGRSRFIWPLRGPVAAKFGIQPNGQKCNGIRIAAREGTPVKASAPGEIIFASPIKYYGETIIIKHGRHYLTVYAFLKSKRAKVGDHVKKGEQIALLGRPENNNGKPYLHFEIRQNHKPKNPLFYLPQPVKKKPSR